MKSNLPDVTRIMLGALALGVTLGATSRPAAAQAAPTQYSQGDPTDSEQYLLQKLNRARMDPSGEGQRLAAWLRLPANAGLVSQYAINPDQVASDFAALPAVPPLAFSADLLASARNHSRDLAPHDGVGPGGNDHAGYDGSTPDSRVYASGFRTPSGSDGYAGENVDPGSANLDGSHASFLVDWGVSDLGHRQLAMNGSNAMNFVGVGLATKAASVDTVLPIVNTSDFGMPGLAVNSNGLTNANVPAILTGVAYRDANGNGLYDPGEGVAGVTVSMEGGAYYAVTTASGGYSLPLVNADGSYANGSVSVRMSGFPNEADHTAVVSVTSFAASYGFYRANVEWDGVAGESTTSTGEISLAGFFGGSSALDQDWYYLAFANGNLFGYYNVSQYPYLYHNDMGWEYVIDAKDNANGVFLYDFASNSWWYTSPSFPFPYIYDFARKTVLYYYPNTAKPGTYMSNPRAFYDFSAKQIITL